MERFEGLLRFEARLERLNAVENTDSTKQLVLEWKSLKNAFEKSLIALEVEKRSLRDVLDANKKHLANLGAVGADGKDSYKATTTTTPQMPSVSTDLSAEPAVVSADSDRAAGSIASDGVDHVMSAQQPGWLVKCSANGPK